jgi:hypothetical protein
VRFLSFALAAAAAVALALAVVVKLAGGEYALGIVPVTLWRLALALLGFAIYALLYSQSRRAD